MRALALIVVVACSAPPLRSPFDVAARRAVLAGEGAFPRPHPALGPPVIDVHGVSYYRDAARTEIDPELRAADKAALAPLRDFQRGIVALVSAYVRTAPADPALARDVVTALGAWARGGALLGEVDQAGGYARVWTLAALAIAYLEVRDVVRDPDVERWLAAVARAVVQRIDPARRDGRNNHRYWAAVAVGAAAIAADDRALFAWAIDSYDVFVAEETGGTLPLEAARGEHALHYHAFALAALEVLADMGAANGIELRARNGALERLEAHCRGAPREAITILGDAR